MPDSNTLPLINAIAILLGSDKEDVKVYSEGEINVDFQETFEFFNTLSSLTNFTFNPTVPFIDIVNYIKIDSEDEKVTIDRAYHAYFTLVIQKFWKELELTEQAPEVNQIDVENYYKTGENIWYFGIEKGTKLIRKIPTQRLFFYLNGEKQNIVNFQPLVDTLIDINKMLTGLSEYEEPNFDDTLNYVHLLIKENTKHKVTYQIREKSVMFSWELGQFESYKELIDSIKETTKDRFVTYRQATSYGSNNYLEISRLDK